jgi:DNA-binding NtrC family response regulator
MVSRMFTEPGPSLAEARRDGAEAAGRALLEALHAEHGGNISAIARAAQATRQQVRQYLRRYGIGRHAKKGKATR